MSRTRRIAVAGLLAATALAAGACSAGQISQTASQVPAVNGNQAQAGAILLRDVRVDFPGARGADAADYSNKRGGSALLLFSAVNTSPDQADTLISITTDVGQVQIVPPAGYGSDQIELKPQRPLVAARPQAASFNSQQANSQQADSQRTDPPIVVQINSLTRDLTPGLTADVKFTFAHNGTVTVPVPIDADTAPRAASPKSPGDSQ